jgi:hypothetical protein
MSIRSPTGAAFDEHGAIARAADSRVCCNEYHAPRLFKVESELSQGPDDLDANDTLRQIQALLPADVAASLVARYNVLPLPYTLNRLSS